MKYYDEYDKSLQIVAGLLVILGLMALTFLAVYVSGQKISGSSERYQVFAHFDRVDGLPQDAKVTFAGLIIGKVESMEMLEETLQVKVTLSIDADYDFIPTDSSASIITAGLLGSKYVRIEPGGSLESYADGDLIELTQSSVNLEDLISKFIAN